MRSKSSRWRSPTTTRLHRQSAIRTHPYTAPRPAYQPISQAIVVWLLRSFERARRHLQSSKLQQIDSYEFKKTDPG
ncbi:unnamed protein product [Closterium sp. NIES-64]|nr:unnamed protein product [Closterium sp. NIES-64]